MVENPPADGDFIEAEIVDEAAKPNTVLEDPEPPRYCRAHPYGTSDPCKGCGIARKNHEEFSKRRHAAILTQAFAVAGRGVGRTDTPGELTRAAPYRCHQCRDTGIVFNGDGRPGLSNVRICEHVPLSWRLATPDELADPQLQRTLADLRAEYA